MKVFSYTDDLTVKSNKKPNRPTLNLVVVACVFVFVIMSAVAARAALTIGGSTISGDSSGVSLDAPGTLKFGASSTTAIQIGNLSSTTTVLGNLNSATTTIKTLNGHIFYADQYPDIPTAVDAAVASGGGTVMVMAPGTYPVTRSINLGNLSQVPVTLECGNGVRILSNITDHSNVVNVFSGSEFLGEGQAHVSDNTYFPCTIAVNSTSHVGDIIANGDQTGGQENMIVDGVTMTVLGSGTVDRAFYHVRGVGAISRHENLTMGNIPTVGVLVDSPSSATFIPTSVSGNGTTVTVTLLSSTTDDPDATGLGPVQSFTMSGCSGGSGSFNGSFTVATITGPNTFSYLASGSGSPTGCSYVPTVSFQGTSGDEDFQNISSVGKSGVTTAVPILVESNANELTDLQFYNINAQGSGAKLFEINGNGGTGLNTPNIIGIRGLHMEAQNNSNVTGLYINDAHDIDAELVSGAAASGQTNDNLISINQSSNPRTYNIKISNISNSNWSTTLVNNINGVTTSQADITDYTYAGIGKSSAQAGGALGLNLFPGAVPTTPIIGDVFTPTSGPQANNPQYYNGATTQSFLTGCGLDVTTVCLWDDFFSSATTNGNVGALGWDVGSVSSSPSTLTYANGSYPHLGLYRITTAAAAGQGSVLSLNGGTSGPLGAIFNQSNWDMSWIFQLGTTGSTSFRVGIINAASATGDVEPASGAWLRYDTNPSCLGCGGLADTTFKFETASSSGYTATDTLQSVNTSNFYKLRLRSGGVGKVIFTLYDTSGTQLVPDTSFCPAGCNVTATLNTSANMAPALIIASATGGASTSAISTIDYWGFKAGGLSR